MSDYHRLARLLGLSEFAARASSGKLQFPDRSITTPFQSYGFPPAFIPIASRPLDFYGYWVHFFSKRAPTIVRMSLEDNYHVVEIARTFEQFAIIVTFQALCANDANETRCRAFLKDVGLTEEDYDEMDDISMQAGGDIRALATHPQFIGNPPLSVCETRLYTGDFPTERVRDDPAGLASCCSLELRSLATRLVPEPDIFPPWIARASRGERQLIPYLEYLKAGSYSKAWLTLNSSGWRKEEVQQALEMMTKRTGDHTLSELARMWSSYLQSGY